MFVLRITLSDQELGLDFQREKITFEKTGAGSVGWIMSKRDALEKGDDELSQVEAMERQDPG